MTTTTTLRRQVSQLPASRELLRRRYDAALARHEARAELRWSRYSIRLLRLRKELLEALDDESFDGQIAAIDPDIARERVRVKRLARMLRDDTLERCREDQATIERLHVELHGRRAEPDNFRAWGNTPSEVFSHYVKPIFEAVLRRMATELEG